MKHSILKTRERMIELIRSGSRDPFHAALATGLSHAPSDDAWRTFAERSPDKWAASVRSLGELSGYQTRSGDNAADVLAELANLIETLDRRSADPGASPVLEHAPIEGEVATSIEVAERASDDVPHVASDAATTTAAPDLPPSGEVPRSALDGDGWPM